MNPQDCVWKNPYQIIMKTILEQKETIQYSITSWYSKIIPVPQAMKIPAAKEAVDNLWAKLEKHPAWNLPKVISKKEVIDEARTKGAIVHFASLMDICHLKMLNWRQSTKNTKVELCSKVVLWKMILGERRIGDYWNIDGSIDLSDSWTGFTQFTLSEKPPEGHMWSGVRLTKRQATSRPDHLWPELWIKLGRIVELKEKHKWAIEKPKLDNAWRLRRIYFIDFDAKEFKETIWNARKKLETSMALAMPCKTSKKCKHGVTSGKTNEFKSNLACILEASESTRLRIGNSIPNYHEDHIAG